MLRDTFWGPHQNIGPFQVVRMSVMIPGEKLEGKKGKRGTRTDSRDNDLDYSCLEAYLEEIKPVG